MRTHTLLIYLILVSTGLFAQNDINKKYIPVDIDSLLKTPATLPDKGYSVTNIQFTAICDGEVREIAGVHRDRFLTFQRQHPEAIWEFTDATAAFKIGDSRVFIPLGAKENRLFKLIEAWGVELKPKVILFAQVLITKHKRYGVCRDFIIRDMVIAPKEWKYPERSRKNYMK